MSILIYSQDIFSTVVFADSVLYATAAFLGATSLVVASHLGMTSGGSVLVGIFVTLAIRLAAIIWKITLPPFLRADRKKKTSL